MSRPTKRAPKAKEPDWEAVARSLADALRGLFGEMSLFGSVNVLGEAVARAEKALSAARAAGLRGGR